MGSSNCMLEFMEDPFAAFNTSEGPGKGPGKTKENLFNGLEVSDVWLTKLRYGRPIKIWNMYTHEAIAEGNRMCLNTNGGGVCAMPDAEAESKSSDWMFIKAGDDAVNPEYNGT